MIPAIIIGREGSKGLPGKNTMSIFGKPLCQYSVDAAFNSEFVSDVYFSTDSEIIKQTIKNCNFINRPKELATDQALADDVFVHAYNEIKNKSKDIIDYIVLMFANAPCITSKMIDDMIIRMDTCVIPRFDSICTVSKYNMFSPYRMRCIDEYKGVLDDFGIDFDGVNCDRNSGIDSYIYDCSCVVVKSRCLENIEDGSPPQKWLGRKSHVRPFYKNREIPALDLDYDWQVGQIEKWIQKYILEN